MIHAPARVASLALLLVCAGAANRASAFQQYPEGVNGVTHVEYYEVHGRTVAEVAADLRRLGPKDAQGRARAGFASSPLRWTYSKRSNGRECNAFTVRVTVSTDIVLPKWVPPADTVPGLLALWNQSMAALTVHENGHKDISVRYAKLIRDQIAAMRAPCRSFSVNADSASNRLVGEMRAAQVRYDAETLHGVTQGTGFPPRPRP